MKNLVVYYLVGVFFTNCSNSLTTEQSKQLVFHYKEKNFFKLDRLMASITMDQSNPDLLLYQATLDNVFNKPMESNRLINTLLKEYPSHFNDTIIKDLYTMLSDNAYRLQDYNDAYYADSIIVNNYRHVCDSSEIETPESDITIFRSLRYVPKMEIKMAENSTVPIKRDMAGLQNLPVTIQNDTVDFVFDTGAAFSVVIESVAKKYGVKILPDKVWTGTSTSKKVEGHMGLLDFKLGSIELKNVALLVFPDSILTFANGIYVIRGVIGFPVIYAFNRFTIKDNNHLMVLQNQSEPSVKNFAIDGQYMIIRVTAHNDTLPFIFDSGNQVTCFSSAFFNKYQSEIVENCKKEQVETGGAGGMENTEAYILDSLTISAGNSQLRLDSIRIYPNDLSGYDMKFVYGNFGQNYVSKFSEMHVDFASMNMEFLGEK